MKLPFLSMLCAATLFCMVGMAVADPDKDESGKGRERHQYSSEKDRTDKKYRQKGWHGQNVEDERFTQYYPFSITKRH
jgi:hypothetical protein